MFELLQVFQKPQVKMKRGYLLFNCAFVINNPVPCTLVFVKWVDFMSFLIAVKIINSLIQRS